MRPPICDKTAPPIWKILDPPLSIKFLSVWTAWIKHANNDMTDRLIIIFFQCVMFDQSQGNAPCPSFCLLPEQLTHFIASHGSVWFLLYLRIYLNLYVEILLNCTLLNTSEIYGYCIGGSQGNPFPLAMSKIFLISCHF